MYGLRVKPRRHRKYSIPQLLCIAPFPSPNCPVLLHLICDLTLGILYHKLRPVFAEIPRRDASSIRLKDLESAFHVYAGLITLMPFTNTTTPGSVCVDLDLDLECRFISGNEEHTSQTIQTGHVRRSVDRLGGRRAIYPHPSPSSKFRNGRLISCHHSPRRFLARCR